MKKGKNIKHGLTTQIKEDHKVESTQHSEIVKEDTLQF